MQDLDIFREPQGDLIEERKKRLTPLGRRITRDEMLNVFTPKQAIRAPAKFVGRQQPLEQMIDALLTRGADILVFGERGCGKSSLAHMLQDIAAGHTELLDYYGLREQLQRRGLLANLISNKQRPYNVIWVDGFNKPLDDVIRAILTRRADDLYGPGLLAYFPREADQEEISVKAGFNKIFTASGEVKEVRKRDVPVNIKEAFELALQQYAAVNENELLIVIDEFETISSRADIAPYLKSARNARFVLVGIGANALDLVEQHASVAREAYAISLPPMTPTELRAILEIGFYLLSNFFKASSSCMDSLVTNAHGSPFWCHFLAKTLIERQLALVRSFSDFVGSGTQIEIQGSDVDHVLRDLQSNPGALMFEAALKQLTLGDPTNARILLHIARQSANELSTQRVAGDVSRALRLPIKKVTKTIHDMIDVPLGPFERLRKIGSTVAFTFRDPNFRRYVLLRNGGGDEIKGTREG